MNKRVIYKNDTLWGTIGESDGCGKRIILDEDGREKAKIEESMIPGKEIICNMSGRKIGEIDNYTGTELFYGDSGREIGEIRYEEEDGDFNPFSILTMLVIGVAKGFYDGWKRESYSKKYQPKQSQKPRQPRPGPGERLREI